MIEDRVKISDIKFAPVRSSFGHIGFVSFVFNEDLFFSSIAVHRRINGGFRLVFPRMREVDIFYPINQDLYRLLETKVIEYLKENIKDVRQNNDRSSKY